MTESGSIASFFFQLSEDSCKALSINDLRGPGRRNPLAPNDLRNLSGFKALDELEFIDAPVLVG
jgi:hypothetical protein